MHWTEKLSFYSMALMLMFIPLDAGTSYVFICLWMFSTVLKNTILKRWSFFGWHQDKNYKYGKSSYLLIPMMVYWGLYLLSMLWTEDKATGWLEVSSLAWFAAVPLTCLCTDFREVTKTRLRNIFWLYVIFMSLLFVLLLVMDQVKPCQLISWLRSGYEFYYLHHSYMAVYIVAGLAFLYSECLFAESASVKKNLLVVLCACCLFPFLLLINSRTGSLGLVMLLVMCWVHLCFIRKKYRASFVMLLSVVLIGCVSYITLPEKFKRLSATTEQVAHGDKSDVRFAIMGNALTVVKENPVLGVGAGDIEDALTPFYGSRADVYRPHNQYLETWMATGVVGVVVLLLMMLVPMVNAFKRRRWLAVSIIIIFAVSILFESMLERQMGVSFFCVMMVLCVVDTQNAKTQLCNVNQKVESINQ